MFRFRGQIVNYQGPGSADSGMPKFDRLKKIGERGLYWAYLQFYFKKMYQCKWKGYIDDKNKLWGVNRWPNPKVFMENKATI